MTTCVFGGCTNTKLAAKGLCWGHYAQRRKGQELRPLRPRPALDRIIDKLDIDGDCWIWLGARTPDGYGRIATSGKKHNYTHRVMWEQLVGPIPDGMTMDHLCRRPPCCNPDHLEPVPIGVNVLRGYGAPAINARKVTCSNGHPYTLLVLPNRTTRQCTTCTRERATRTQRERRRRNRDASLPLSPPLPQQVARDRTLGGVARLTGGPEERGDRREGDAPPPGLTAAAVPTATARATDGRR